jgi:adenylate cyclase
MFTDIVGSTALAQTDEAEALRLRDEQDALLRRLFRAHHGRAVKSMGDGFLAEFDSALRAAECAIDIQHQLRARNSRQAGPPIHLRIGIHLGDVEARGKDIVGDAVNVASRVEPLAEPGGICITEPVYGLVRNKLPNRFERLTPQALKNVRFPLDIYRVLLGGDGELTYTQDAGPTGLAVLPFVNISQDPNDAYFADGLTEELITVLSHMKGLRVIARTSVMPYRATTKGVSQIGGELRVTSVLEGSVRKSGNRLRVAAQLIDVRSEGHLWAQTYDRELDDIFSVQSEVARRVAEALRVELRPAEAARLGSRPRVRADSYVAFLRGRTLLHEPTLESLEAARQQFLRAISLDSTNAAAHSGLAVSTCQIGWWYPDALPPDWLSTSRDSAARAIELDPTLAEPHEAVALILETEYDYLSAETEFRAALDLNPSYSLAHHNYASILQEEGRAEEALRELELAEAADPFWVRNLLSSARLLVWMGRPEEALVRIRKMQELAPEGTDYYSALFTYHISQTHQEAALSALLRVEELTSEPRRKAVLHAGSLTVSGKTTEAIALLRHEETLPELAVMTWWIAMAYAELGLLDDCFRLMDRAADAGYLALHECRLDPRLAPVRNDPRFDRFLNRLDLA